ncbi:integral membrane protein [Alcanivorax hongdengensis A-11-3]|uniref:Integral membrane protein n=1 Tax=Alcanivorax hongdengensis A-11-3 TaxID=1177179 RepID=L0WH60_9GAMM|nr:DUF2238 domain-containing protein [Alcanivorax hongdengensis]EKF76054.1 integral membrane protein [Alcanivorax hongdengensis A-11-3]
MLRLRPQPEPEEAMPSSSDNRYALILFCLFWLAWVPLAIDPLYPHDWLLENMLVFISVPLVWIGWRRYHPSRTASTAIFLFALLHILGAHYTYAEVPYNHWTTELFGSSLNEALGWQRNHFDRLVHGLFGLLFMPLFAEIFQQRLSASRRWQAALGVTLVLAISAVYEIIEWLAAISFGGDLGQAYLGTQGDAWDAQKDMALAGLGAVIGAIWISLRNLDRRQ